MVGDPQRGSGSGTGQGDGTVEHQGSEGGTAPMEPPLSGPALVQRLAAMQPYDEEAIVAGYGWDILRDVQVCRALAREGTQLNDSLGSAEAGSGHLSEPDVVVRAAGSGLLPRPSQEEDASSGDSIFPQQDPARG